MNLLRPTKIILEGFRSFRQRVEIPFPERGAVLINGRHKDGTTESGSGKSSVLIGMYYALGYCDIAQTELKNWYSKGMYVELHLTDDVNTYVVIRDPKLKLIQNGIPYDGTSEGAAEILKDLLKLSPELMTALTYRPQREVGKFINQTDAEGKEFLSVLLNLTQIEQGNDTLLSELSAISGKVKILNAEIENSKLHLNQTAVSVDAYEQAKKVLAEANDRLAKLSVNDSAAQKISTDLNTLDQEQSKLNQVNYEVGTSKNEIANLRLAAGEVQKQIETLKQKICPTCTREWDLSANLLGIKQEEIKRLVEMVKAKLAFIKNAEPLLNPAHQNAINTRRAELSQALMGLKAPVQDALNYKNLAQQNFNTLQNAINTSEAIKARLVGKGQELKNLEIDEYLTKHAVDITSRTGFLSEIFDEILQDITRRANDIMSYIPNVNTFSLNISSTSVTQKGKINKKIEKSLVKDNRKVSIKSISGGQKTSIELSADLAMGEAIRARSGSPLGWVALDEAMDGLGVSTKMAVLDVIKSKVKGLIIVVDHSTEIKEAFDSVIDIEFDGRDSYVV